MFGKTPNYPVPAAPPPPPTPPSYGSSQVKKAGSVYATTQLGGLASTIMTSPQGDLTPANTAKKTLLGQ